jgi:hypothetical protein
VNGGRVDLLLLPASIDVHQKSSSRKEKAMREYTAPTLTRIGSFEAVTKSLGSATEHDVLGFRALIVIHWPS